MSGPWEDFQADPAPAATAAPVAMPAASPAAAPAQAPGPDAVAAMVADEARRQGVNPALAVAVARREAGFDQSQVSPKGAIGVMQLMPGTAKDLGVDPNDLADNIRGGVKYLRQQQDTFNGDPVLMAAAYNAGPGAVMAHGGVPPIKETQDYVQAVAGGGAAPAAGAAPAQSSPAAGPWSDFQGADPGAVTPAGKVPISVVDTDTGQPFNDPQERAYAALMKAGQYDQNADAGSKQRPLRQGPDSGPAQPGQWYMDQQGVLHQQPGAIADALAALPSGFLRSGANLLDQAVDAGPMGILRHAANMADAMSGGTPDPIDRPAPWFSNVLTKTLPTPTTTAGRYLEAIGENIPNALAGPEGLLPKAASVVLPAVAGEGAADFIKGSGGDATQQAIARGIGNLAGFGGAAGAEAAGSRLAASARGGEAAAAPAQADAMAYVRRIMDRGGATPETLAAADQDLTPAEAIGRTGTGALRLLARQPGTTGEKFAELAGARAEARGDAILGAVSDALGVDPSATRGLKDQMVLQGQKDAEPLYRAALEDPTPVMGNVFTRLAARPSVKNALGKASDLMREEGEDPNALGIAFLENPADWESATPPPFDQTAGEPERSVGFAPPRGPARAPSQGPSLAQFLASKGGLVDVDGELADMGADAWHLGKPGQRKLVADPNAPTQMFSAGRPSPMQPDNATEAAFRAGYFPDRPEAPSVDDLYGAIRDEMRGRSLYARPADQAAQSRFDRTNAAEELGYRGGDPADLPSPDQYVGRPEPREGPVDQVVPTLKTLDYVKRALDDELAPFRSGKLDWTDKARAIDRTRSELVGALRDYSPSYAKALEGGADYLHPEEAFDLGRSKLINQGVDATDWENHLAGLTDKGLQYFRAGVANRIYDGIQASQSPAQMMGALRSPLVKQKLAAAFGSKKAQAVIDAVAKQARMKGAENYVLSGSATADALEQRELQDAAGEARQFGVDLASNAHRGLRRALDAAGGRFIARKIDGMLTAGLSGSARDAAGQMLVGVTPAELAEIIRKATAVGAKPLRAGPALRGMIGAGAAVRAATVPQPPQGPLSTPGRPVQ